MIFVLMLTTACGPKVIRDAETFKVETLAAEKRQTEAAAALFDAAERARVSGDRLLCAEYAIPALLIEAFAVAQSRRALYLAGLLDEDPGPSPEPRDVNDVCGEN